MKAEEESQKSLLRIKKWSCIIPFIKPENIVLSRFFRGGEYMKSTVLMKILTSRVGNIKLLCLCRLGSP